MHKEIWIGGGVSWPIYRDLATACGRGGIGAVFADHFVLGVSAQVDREHFHYFADAGLISPAVWGLEPYGRFQVGRRNDRDDTATGWAFGLRLGDTEGVTHLFLEGHGIIEPEENNGISFGIVF